MDLGYGERDNSHSSHSTEDISSGCYSNYQLGIGDVVEEI